MKYHPLFRVIIALAVLCTVGELVYRLSPRTATPKSNRRYSLDVLARQEGMASLKKRFTTAQIDELHKSLQNLLERISISRNIAENKTEIKNLGARIYFSATDELLGEFQRLHNLSDNEMKVLKGY